MPVAAMVILIALTFILGNVKKESKLSSANDRRKHDTQLSHHTTNTASKIVASKDQKPSTPKVVDSDVESRELSI
eukprot:CAMPEP_0204839538 /NCGR_PEP_ID=MMETSP1346-20131115/34641_1 /ASSEMBLY_ACC=CAM_ASM_000771 /TAXON_ID=215587 /ORGANISM="Aplanochytrium stocchinoi, Strain GSBS06" /LENGTH=74 /DNA_ID=CAMNT_0051976357 /DNA_START=562 /DNA_END=786 /DNA_ORIENTATION=-